MDKLLLYSFLLLTITLLYHNYTYYYTYNYNNNFDQNKNIIANNFILLINNKNHQNEIILPNITLEYKYSIPLIYFIFIIHQ